MKSKIILSMFILLCVLLATACGDAPTSSANRADKQIDRPSNQSELNSSSTGIEPNNNSNFWEEWTPLYYLDPEFKGTISVKNPADVLELAQKCEASFRKEIKNNRKGYNDGISLAIDYYTEVVQKNPEQLNHTLDLINESFKYDTDFLEIGASIFALLNSYPNSNRLTSFFPRLRVKYLNDLKKNRFDYKKRHLIQKDYDDVYGEGYFVDDYAETLAMIAKISGNKAEERMWQYHLADYYLFSHFYDDKTIMARPDWAVAKYRELGDEKYTQLASLDAGDNYLKVYLHGYNDPASGEVRDPFCDYDLDQARIWYGQGGMDLGETNVRIRRLALQAADECKKNATGKEGFCQQQQDFALSLH